MTDTNGAAAPTDPLVTTTTQEPAAPVTTGEQADPTTEAAPSQPDASGDPATPPENTDPVPKPDSKKGKGVQDRISQLTRERNEERFQTQQLKRELETLRKQDKTSLDADPGPEPKIEDFTTVEDYVSSHAQWAKREGYRTANTEFTQKQQQQKTIAAIAAFETREGETKQKYSDYDQSVEAVGEILLGNPTLKSYIVESETGPEVAYHLAKNPSVLLELTRMSPLSAVRELVKLEQKLSAPTPPKTLTKAPEPITPVGARDTVKQSLSDLAEKDPGSYIARRNREELKRLTS